MPYRILFLFLRYVPKAFIKIDVYIIYKVIILTAVQLSREYPPYHGDYILR